MDPARRTVRVGRRRVAAPTAPERVRRVARGLAWRLNRLAQPEPVVSGPAGTVTGDVVVYFGDDAARLYQLDQWVPVLERLAATHPTMVVTRRQDAYDHVTTHTSLPVVLLPALRDLAAFYDRVDPKVALYVNNGNTNFQSLASTRMLHVHINHGESDKVSMVSNQAKAYDRVFVAGDAAVRRHRSALMDFDESRLVRVGRPQLDLHLPPALPPTERSTVVYAPTWEGEAESNNYTSLDRYGRQIADAALALPGVRFVYKSHPRVELGAVPGVAEAHESVVRAVQAAARRDPAAGHVVATRSMNILALLPQADLLVSDVSSVALDFLYLRTDRPLVLTDRRSDPSRLVVDAPVSQVCEVIDETNLARVGTVLATQLRADEHRADRDALRRLYFGDLQPGQSTSQFIAAVDELVRHRDALIGTAAHGSTVG